MPVDAKAESVQKLITKLCCPQMLAVAAQAGADEREGGFGGEKFQGRVGEPWMSPAYW